MKVMMLGEAFEYKNERSAVEKMFREINQRISASSLVFSHLEVDGEKVFEEHYDYVLENLNHIECIKVKMKSEKELMNEILLSAEEYLKRAIPEVQILAEEFYNQPNEQSWVKFEQLLEGMEWLWRMVVNITEGSRCGYKNDEEYHKVASVMEIQVKALEGAVQYKDIVLLGDLLTYEILPLLEQMQNIITATLDNEGERKELH